MQPIGRILEPEELADALEDARLTREATARFSGEIDIDLTLDPSLLGEKRTIKPANGLSLE